MKLRSPVLLALPFTLSFLAVAGGGCGGGGSGGSGGGAGGGAPEQDRDVVVLFTSDEHSHLFAFAPELDDYPLPTAAGAGALVGGVARRAALLASERKAAIDAGKDSITVSSGDNQMGGLAHVAFESDSIDYGTMKALGYDVTTLGNHEFDFGPKALAKSINTAKAGSGLPAVVASNIHFSGFSPDDDDLAALYSDKAGDSAAIHPYQVVTTSGGVKIGVLGYVGVNAEHVAPNKKPVKFSANAIAPALEGQDDAVLPELYKDLQPVVDTLRNTEKVDLVIALSHAGLGDTSTDEAIAKGEDYLVAENVSGIDLIVSGHSHIPDPKPITATNAATGKGTLILNGSAYGQHVGRVEFMVHADGSPPTWLQKTQALLPVDDTTVPDPSQAKATDGLLSTIEAASFVTSGSYLEGLLSRVTGAAVKDDTSKAGDLYFYPIGKTGFDLGDVHAVLALSSDSMLAAADAWGASSSKKTDMGLESAGVIRSLMKKGKTGVISAADAFNVVPLGSSPVDGTLGYPLVRAYISLLELRAVFEASVAVGKTNDQFDLMTAGMKVEYDATRPPALGLTEVTDPAKGQVMRILLDSDHSDGFEQFDTVIYDRTNSVGDPLSLYAVVTSSYIAQFATDVGASLKDDKGNVLALADVILHRPDSSEIKQVEAFMGFIHAAAVTGLPPLYDPTSPMAANRFDCIAGCP